MSTSPRAGSVNSRASSTVTPGISPTVSIGSVAPGEHLAVHLLQELVDPRPVMKCSEPSASEPGSRVGSAGSLEIMLMTSMRKPSTPRSSHQRIIE